VLAVVASAGALGLLSETALAISRPPQPVPFGTIQWHGEAGVTVDGVTRTVTIGRGPRALRASGEFYIVRARILAPFGLRPHWSDRYVEVDTFAGSGATMPARRFSVDERAQAVLDREDGRPGSEHEVRGAEQRELLVFDLPKNVEQPGLVFLPANDLLNIPFYALHARFWQPHRFNLRFD
jgi:hypothetical protein